ncbi:hypothetical protein Tco_1057318 [Tanacetum coccineum]|uniref:Uncharacterized protein n=1 Tax=Tanacetum coccineum TaxID=301880 RepID=A0ABQ5H5Z6_9ASTR
MDRVGQATDNHFHLSSSMGIAWAASGVLLNEEYPPCFEEHFLQRLHVANLTLHGYSQLLMSVNRHTIFRPLEPSGTLPTVWLSSQFLVQHLLPSAAVITFDNHCAYSMEHMVPDLVV